MNTYTYEEALQASTEYFGGDDLAAEVFLGKHALHNADGELIEKTPDDMHWRIAKEFARIEKGKFKKPLSEEEVYSYLRGFGKIVPQGSPMYGIGNESQYVSLSNCFVIASPLDSYGAILQADEELAQIAKRRGGDGLDIANLRPEGVSTRNAARTSTGTIPFCQRFSNTIREVGQNGRRGALMISQSIHHPESVKLSEGPYQEIVVNAGTDREIRTTTEFYDPANIDFATMKYDTRNVTGANVSLRLTDEFLNAVDAGTTYQQRWPVDSPSPTVSRDVDAKRVWNKIVRSAWQMAEPGLLFWDNILRESPADCYGMEGFTTTSTNPCFSGSSNLLTKDGYTSFGELYKSKNAPVVMCDDRIEYDEEKSDWIIKPMIAGVTGRQANQVQMTHPSTKVIRIRTKIGMELVCTPDHLIATTDGMVEAQKLSQEHKILVAIPKQSCSVRGQIPSTDEEKMCFLMGLIAGDGTFDRDRSRVHIDLWGDDSDRMESIVLKIIDDLHESIGDIRNDRGRSFSKYFVTRDAERIKVRISSAWLACILNDKFSFSRNSKHVVPSYVVRNARHRDAMFYVQGLFYADGDCGGSDESGYSVRLSQSNERMLKDVQLVLHANGMLFGLYHRRNARIQELPGGTYLTKDQYQLISIAGSRDKFRDLIGFAGHSSDAKLDSFRNSVRIKSSFTTSITSIEDAGEEAVYCIEEPVTKSIIVNGISTRRCGEIPLSAYDSCRLLLLNLFGFVVNPFQKDAYFDWKAFYEAAIVAQRLMDDLVDLEAESIRRIIQKINDDPEPYETKSRELFLWTKILSACITGRRTGTGITALADTLAAIGIGYGTDEGIQTTERIYKTLKFAAYQSSVDMARELGAFGCWNHSLEVDNPFLNRIRNETIEVGDEVIRGSDLWEDMRCHGRRNIALLTTAPAGSVSIETQTSSGIEPQFSIDPYTRRKKGNPGDKNFRSDFVDQNGDHWQEFTVYPHKVKMWMDVTGETDLKKSPWYNHTAQTVNWETRVRLQAAAQKHVDHSISSTLNLPNDVTVEEVDKIYRTAWKAGCKGVTIYRDGCRTGVLVQKKESAPKIAKTDAPKRPQTLPCDVYHIRAKGKDWFVLIGLLDGEPFECFAGENGMIAKSVSKGTLTKESRGKYHAIFEDGSELKNVAEHISDEEEAVTRLVSTALRHGTSIDFVVHQLEKVKGDMTGFARAMARALKKYIPDGTEVKGEACPNCSSNKIVRQEGCVKCAACGWTKCS